MHYGSDISLPFAYRIGWKKVTGAVYTEGEGITQKHESLEVGSLEATLGSFCLRQDLKKWMISKLKVLKMIHFIA